MPAPALAAIPILVSFAEAAGIVVAGVATAAGIDTLSKKVEEYVEENPEQSQKILAMIMPSQGIANILKNESDDGEEVSETEVTVESEPRSKKEIVLEEVARGRAGRGNFSSPDAEGPAVSITGNVKRGLRDAGKIRQGNDANYDASKKYQGYKRFIRPKKADGGIMGGNKTYHQVRDQFMPMDSESMEYANGGGVGSMMKRKSFKGGGSDASKSDFGKSKSTNREKGIMSRGKGPKGTTGNINNTSSDNNPIVNRTIENNNPDKYRFAKLKKEPAGLTVLQDIFPFLNKYKAPPAILNEPEEDTKFDYKLLNSFLSEDPLLQTYYDKGLLKNNNIKKFNENEFKKGYMSNEEFQKDISEDKRDLHGYTYTGGTQFPTPETAKNIYINNLESFKKPVGPLYGTKELSDYKGNVGKDFLDAKTYSLGPVTAPGGQRDFLTNREIINKDLNSDSKFTRENALSNIFGYYNSAEDVLEDTYQRKDEGMFSGERDENGNPYKVGYSGTDSPTMTERNKQIAETIGHEARHQLIGTNLTDESKFTAPFGPASFEERFANSLPSLPGTNLGATDRSGKSNFPGVYDKHESLNRMLDFKAYNDPGIYETVYEGIGMPRNLTNRYTDALDKNANLFTQQFANGGGVGSMMQPKKKRVSFKGGGADMGATDKAQERADRGYGSTAPADDRSTQQQTDNNNRVTGNNNTPTISFSPVVQYQDNPILNSPLPTGVLGIDTNLGNSFKVRSMIDAVNTLKEDELIGDLEINAVLGDLGIRGYMDNEKNKNLDINYNDGTLSGQFNTDFENLNNLGIGFDKNGYTGNISTDFENTNARVGKTIDNPFGLKGNLTFGADTDFDKNKNIGFQYGMSFENGGRVNYNQGSNWWDTLDPQGMNVYNSMKRGGHDDATIQSQLAMLGYYDPNTAPPDSTPDVPNIINQNINQGGDGGGGITASGPGLGYKGPGSTVSGNFNIDDIAEGTVDSDDLSFGLSLKEGIFGLQRMLGNIPTPLNLALKAANKFKNYRADKKEEAAAKQSALDAINASMARDQRINNQQDWTGGSDNYSGGMDSNTGNYNDPYDSGYAD